MGVKSTVELTREEAIDQIAGFVMAEYRKVLEARFTDAPDRELEDKLEALADLAAGGESFNNYMIIS